MTIADFTRMHFCNNPGFDTKVPFNIEGDNYKFTHVDTEFTEEGITRFQGVISYKTNAHSLYGRYVVIPLWLFPYIESYKITTIYEPISSICYTIWFKQPLTKNIIDTFPKRFDN